VRYGAANDPGLRRWAASRAPAPLRELVARSIGPVIHYYARTLELDGRRANEAGVREALAALPELLDHTDELVADGTLTLDPPNAAALQILVTVRSLESLEDLRPYVASRPSAVAARELFPRYAGSVPPFLPASWLPAARS